MSRAGAVAGTVGEAIAAATDALEAAGVASPRLDAELLLAEAAGTDRTGLAADPGAPVSPAAGRRFGALVRRRVAREPVAYLLGRKGFRRLELAVDRRALIPRPETELLVEVALELAWASVLDVGTGSGAVALAIADELASARIDATDTSSEAIELARENAARLGAEERVRFQVASLVPGEYDVVVANLPYVTESEWPLLEPEITRYEPRSALVAGPSGLEATEWLLGSLPLGPVRAGAVALEVGAGQAARVAELVREAGYGRVEVRRDLAGIERVVVGRP